MLNNEISIKINISNNLSEEIEKTLKIYATAYDKPNMTVNSLFTEILEYYFKNNTEQLEQDYKTYKWDTIIRPKLINDFKNNPKHFHYSQDFNILNDEKLKIKAKTCQKHIEKSIDKGMYSEAYKDYLLSEDEFNIYLEDYKSNYLASEKVIL